MQYIIKQLSEISTDDLTIDHIRTITIVRLPFHLCTGTICEIADPDNAHLQIWLRNKVSIRHANLHEQYAQFCSLKNNQDIFTDALIVNCQPQLSPSDLEAIKTGKIEAINHSIMPYSGFKLLNEIIAAHQMVRLGPYIPHIDVQWPRMLNSCEIFERILFKVVLITEPNSAIDQNIILRLLSNVPSNSYIRTAGDLRDYSNEQISILKLAVQKIRKHAFYELKTKAITAMLSGDSVVAIVLGCAALEGAHGFFMRLALREKIPGDTGKFNSFMNSLLREQGFFSLVQLSVRVLMEEKERPTEDDLIKCLQGVTVRNAIMHAGIKGTGKYKIREYSTQEISEGYSGIMAIYKAFETAVESRENLELDE